MANSLKRPNILRPFDRQDSLPDREGRIRGLTLAALQRQQLERGRLARVLHDEVAQILTGAGLQLDILRMDLEDHVPGIGSRTAGIQSLLNHVVRQIRDLSYELNPDLVERVGLQAALDLLVGRHRKYFTGSLRLIYETSIRLPAPVAVAMERIAEEAVANAVRHARCTEIEIIVMSTLQGVALEVRDNGCGFDYDQASRSAHGLGLHLMEYCASKAGLQIRIAGRDNKGATVSVGAALEGDHAIQCASRR